MSDEILRQQIDDLINGTISEAAHQELQERLKSDKKARHVFRERMDLEAGLRTCAADGLIDEQPAAKDTLPTEKPKHSRSHWKVALLATAASILGIAVWWVQGHGRVQPEVAEQQSTLESQESSQTAMLLGRVVPQADCLWGLAPSLQGDRFSTGMIKLASGAAELRFDSGTNVILEGPCELEVETTDSARLLAGTVFVDVTEVSNGFLLETPEAQIIDDGTKYAVSLDSQATEVHVFDGSVIWTPTKSDANFEDRITSGEARRYLRGEPGQSHHIPFGQRQFVRRIEEAAREAGGGELLAYDGFENLAGQLRRGRSGFGWAGGWQSVGRGRGPLADVIDAPEDVVFGIDRSGRRLLLFRGGESLRRQLEKPTELSPGKAIFVSLLICRQSSMDEDDSSTQIVLEPESGSRRYANRHSVSFGVTSMGQPFLNNAGTIHETAMTLVEGDTYLFVFKYVADNQDSTASLRIYGPNSTVDLDEPTVWTVVSSSSVTPTNFTAIRFTAGQSRDWQVDELKVASSWSSVVMATYEAGTNR
jgi:ferric-dicitrate binding protein FerR (iron transport regulator)